MVVQALRDLAVGHTPQEKTLNFSSSWGLFSYGEIKNGMVGKPVKDARSVPCRRNMYLSHIDISYEMCWGSCIALSFSGTRRELLCTRESISSCDSGLASSFEEDKGLLMFVELVLTAECMLKCVYLCLHVYCQVLAAEVTNSLVVSVFGWCVLL